MKSLLFAVWKNSWRLSIGQFELLSDESPAMFLKTVKELLGSSDVRFHLKHLILEVIGQIEEPSEPLFNYLLELFANDYWGQHAKETVFIGQPQYVGLLVDKGLVSDALDSCTV